MKYTFLSLLLAASCAVGAPANLKVDTQTGEVVGQDNFWTGNAAGIAGALGASFQPLDPDLTEIAALSTHTYGRSFLALINAAAARALLALGTAAVESTETFATAAQGTKADGAIQATGAFGENTLTAQSMKSTYALSYFISGEMKLRVALASAISGTFQPLLSSTGTYALYTPPNGDDLRDPSIKRFGDVWYCAYTSGQYHSVNVTADASTDLLTSGTHRFPDGTQISFATTGTLPAPLVTGTTKYYVRDSGTNNFKVAATVGGAAIDITTAGSGTHTAAAFGGNNYFGLAKSTNLRDWEFVANPVGNISGGVVLVWAPEWFVDVDGRPVIYYYRGGAAYYLRPTSSDFSTWGDPVAVGGNIPIPGSPDYMVWRDGARYYMMNADDRQWTSSNPVANWETSKAAGTATAFEAPEGPCVLNLGAGNWLMIADERYYNPPTHVSIGLKWSVTYDYGATWSTPTPIIFGDEGGAVEHQHGTLVRFEQEDLSKGENIPASWAQRNPAVMAEALSVLNYRLSGPSGSSGTGWSLAAASNWLHPGQVGSSTYGGGGIGAYNVQVGDILGQTTDLNLGSGPDWAVVFSHGGADNHLKISGTNARAWIQLGSSNNSAPPATRDIAGARGTLGVEFTGKAGAGIGADDNTIYARVWSWSGTGSGGTSTLTYGSWVSLDAVGARRCTEATVLRYRTSDRTFNACQIINNRVINIGSLTLPAFPNSDSILSCVFMGGESTANDTSAAVISREHVKSIIYTLPAPSLPDF